MARSKDSAKKEPYAITARFSEQHYHDVLVISRKLGLTRHRALQLCYAVGISVLSGQSGFYTPAPREAAPHQQQQG